MSEHRPRRHDRPATLALGLPVLLLVLLASPLELAAVPLSECLVLQVDTTPVPRNPTLRWAAAAAEHEAILALVRAHRRGADPLWQEQLTDAIYFEAHAADVDPLIVASIVARESSFKTTVVSHAGAVGLMQLRPFVAKDVARRSAMPWQGRATLESPDLNVRIGIRYYKELVLHFDGDRTMALTAYNQGPTRVRRNVRLGSYAGSRYAQRILDLHEDLRSDAGGASLALAG